MAMKVIEILGGILLIIVLAVVFRMRRGAGNAPVPQKKDSREVYMELRQQALTATADVVGLPVPAGEPFGVLMETGMGKAVVTLLGLRDGTASLYFSSGGGIIGAGGHEAAAMAAKRFVASAKHFTSEMQPATTFPLPALGQVRFYVLTSSGVLAYQGVNDDLGNNRDALSTLFHDGHKLIYEIRLVDEKIPKRR